MTREDAYALAAQHPGVTIRRTKGTWYFKARIHTTHGSYCRYAGKDIDRALAALEELREMHSKRRAKVVA